MAMLIAWQTVNAVSYPRRGYSKAFLVVTPGITIRDRLRVLLPNDPDSYYRQRGLVPAEMLEVMQRARIVITNYHAFKPRQTMDVTPGGRKALAGHGSEPQTAETEDRMVARVCGDLEGHDELAAFRSVADDRRAVVGIDAGQRRLRRRGLGDRLQATAVFGARTAPTGPAASTRRMSDIGIIDFIYA